MSTSQASSKPDLTAMVKHAVRNHVRDDQIIGLGSGRAVATFVRELGRRTNKKKFRIVATSLQIEVEAENAGLLMLNSSTIDQVDVVFDGADQIDANLFMIKGGGGALLREKILMYSARKVIILADASKYVDQFRRSVPIEVIPFARSTVARNLSRIGAKIELRQYPTGYPFFTDNGNVIFDASFPSIQDPEALERELTRVPGIVEVGIFTRRADLYYEVSGEGSFRTIVYSKNGKYSVSEVTAVETPTEGSGKVV
jgi:ribose 5-phosphate isomerase A